MANEIKSVEFLNFTDEDFTCNYDGVPYIIKAGQTFFCEEWRAKHFAKHLIDRELNKRNVRTNDQSARVKLMEKCLVTATEVFESIDQAKVEILNKNEKKGKECCGSKGHRHKKECPTLIKNDDGEKEFPDLNE
jgi:hypothetical protein|tara:strand:+ start:5179 stop:5580 length:402 start_codon:yes stop_codon:yes gene_type:complete